MFAGRKNSTFIILLSLANVQTTLIVRLSVRLACVLMGGLGCKVLALGNIYMLGLGVYSGGLK